MPTSSQTKNPRPDEQPETDESRSNGQHGDETAAQVDEQAQRAAVDATSLVPAIARQTQDGVLHSVRLWTELMTRLTPFAVPSPARADTRPGSDAQPGEAPAFPAQAWVEGAFDLTETLLANQRHYVDQLLAAQRQVIGQFFEVGATLATASPVTLGARPART